uniref:Uncharacterized protein n=1 Tax=Oryza glaberrima TaxID=4538 RepID=I1Q084_ORYGL
MRRCRAFGGDAVPVHLPIGWLVLNGFLKRERGEHGVGGGGEGGGVSSAVAGAAVVDAEAEPPR